MSSYRLLRLSLKRGVIATIHAVLLVTFFIVPSKLLAADVSLTWNPNTEPDLAGYRIYQRTLPSTDYGPPIFSGLPSNPSSPQLLVPNLIEGETYGFIATAVDTSGNESSPSVEKQATVAASENQNTPTTEDPVILDTPADTQTTGSPTSAESTAVVEEETMPLPTTEELMASADTESSTTSTQEDGDSTPVALEEKNGHSNKPQSTLTPPCPSPQLGPPGHSKNEDRDQTRCSNNGKATTQNKQTHKKNGKSNK